MDKWTLLTVALASLLMPSVVRSASSSDCPTMLMANVTYGPSAGGTVIGLTSNVKDENQLIYWCGVCDTWDVNCTTNISANWNNVTMTMTTPRYNVNETVNICCVTSCNMGCQNAVNFTYMPDPVITPVPQNMTSVVNGGIQQMIYGVNLDSVKCPKLIVYSTNDSVVTDINYPWSCPPKQGSATVVTLYTPNVNASRNLPPAATYSQVINNPRGLEFYVNITFDGIVFPGIPLTVYSTPYLVPLTPLTTFIANENNYITIQGANLTGTGFTQSDVNVTVGDPSVMTNGIQCTNITLTASAIMCQPPPLEAMDIMYPPSSGPNPAQPNVTVVIGWNGYQFQANQLQYTLSEPFNVIMIIMIAVLGAVIVVSLLFVALTCCGVGRRPATLLEAVPKKYTMMTGDNVSTKSRQSFSSSGEGSSSAEYRSGGGKTATITKKTVTETSLSESSGGIQVKVVRKTDFDNDAYENFKL